MVSTDYLIEAIQASLIMITHPRFYETERGFQGQFVSIMNAKLEEVGGRIIILEEEYQKVIGSHGLKIRPDIIFHISFEGSGFENRRQGNFVTFELKLHASQKEAFSDFDKLEQMREALEYPLGIFINIDSDEIYLGNYTKRTDIELYSFAVKLANDQVIIHKFNK